MVRLRVMAIPVGNKEATFVFSVDGNTRSITFAIGIADLDVLSPRTNLELADLISQNWSVAGAPFQPSNMPSEYNLLNVTVTEMTETGPLTAISANGSNGSGGQAPVPINSALLVTKNTALGGRRNKGRMYVPPFLPGESQVDANGNLAAGVQATLQGQFDVATDGDLADDIGYLLYHQTGDPTPTAITSLVVNNLIATQRRRMRG